MAGRGRGRGRGGGMTFSAEVLGFGRGEALPPPTLQPPPTFPTLEYKPVPLTTGEDKDYMLLLKQEFRSGIRSSPYFIKAEDKKKDIERYSDKYHYNGNSDNTIGWTPDWDRLPKELKIRVRKPMKRDARLSSIKPNIPVKKERGEVDNAEVEKKLKDLEKKEEEMESGDEEEKEENEEEYEDDEHYDEEDQEEGTDYISNYFDNGEDYAVDEDDGLDDGPIY
ncbi:DNA-directed RNA polymerase III subunit RPC7-like [Amphiura filiformis]|uniref:DNA-directed RNA polymerase III subunit RPC7-like n=1 Tax=Amphiura filiformis TaxID=82378 RepID=UPI003B20E94A